MISVFKIAYHNNITKSMLSLNWLNINNNIHYRILYITYIILISKSMRYYTIVLSSPGKFLNSIILRKYLTIIIMEKFVIYSSITCNALLQFR